MLLENGAEVDAKDALGRTALYLATIKNRTEIMRTLIDGGADLNAAFIYDDFEMTPLKAAVKNGVLEQARMLIQNGASVDRESEKGITPLTLAIMSKNIDMIKLLLKSGANPSGSRKRETPLMIAVWKDDLKAVKLLLRFGADPNLETLAGASAIKAAVIGKRLKIAETLIEAGAKVAGVTFEEEGTNLLHIAAGKNFTEIIPLLASHGVDVNRKAKKGFTPLHLAVTSDCLASVERLIEAGADVNARYMNEDGLHVHTGLNVAVQHENYPIVKALVEAGADVNDKYYQKATPLHFAAQTASVRIAKYLVLKGAEVNALNTQGVTPYDLARCFSPTLDMQQYLQVKGGYSKFNSYKIKCVRDIEDGEETGGKTGNPFIDDLYGNLGNKRQRTVKTIEPKNSTFSAKLMGSIGLIIFCVLVSIGIKVCKSVARDGSSSSSSAARTASPC